MCPAVTEIWNFCQRHTAFFALLGLAMVTTMPDDPPAGVKALPRWAYGWLHDLLKTFVSFRTSKK